MSGKTEEFKFSDLSLVFGSDGYVQKIISKYGVEVFNSASCFIARLAGLKNSTIIAATLTYARSLILGQAATAFSIIEAAATFTALTAADSVATPGKLQVSSAGVHGLTTGTGLAGVNVYVTWTGTNHTGVDGFYPIKSVDDTKTITLDTPSAGFANMGTPAVALANTKLTLGSLTVPGGFMGANGALRVMSLWSCTNSANAKTANVEFSTMVTPSALTNLASFVGENMIRNRGVTNSQVGQAALSDDGSTAVLTAAIDTTADQTLKFTAQPSTANEVMTLEGYTVEILPA
jgi:hypothetical protein